MPREMLEAGSREDTMVVSPTGSGPGPGGVLSPSPWHGEKNPVMMLHGSTSLDDADERGSIVSMESDGSTNGPFFWYRVFSKFSPGPRNCHSSTMIGNTMLVFGGFGGSKWFDEIWTFDTHDVDWKRPDVNAQGGDIPPPRYAHSAVSFRGLLYLFGGFGGDDNWLGDLWVLDTQGLRVRGGGGWSRPPATGTPPEPRAAHTATVAGHRIWIFGGNTGDERMNDVYSLDTQTLVWSKEVCSGCVPPPRAGHTMCLIRAQGGGEAASGGGVGGELIMFGGGDITDVFNDLYVLDTETLEWRCCETSGMAPLPRAGHTMEVLPDGIFLVWGGGGIERVFNDLHLLDPRSMTWSGSVDLGKMVPEPRVGHTMCARGSEVFIFGGGDSQTVFGDLIVLDTDALSGHWAGRRGNWGNNSIGTGGDGVLSRAAVQLNWTSPSSLRASPPPRPPPAPAASTVATFSSSQQQLAKSARAGDDDEDDDEDDEDEDEDEEADEEGDVGGEHRGISRSLEQGKDAAPGPKKGGGGGGGGGGGSVGQHTTGKASLMQDRFKQLEHKLHNRPSKADLEHLNILKGSNGVEPNIHAAQQRLMMRKRGAVLESKLHRRPNLKQLVMHNIIPEDDEYVDHEVRLWGHVPGVVQQSLGGGAAIEMGLTKLEDLLAGHIKSAMGGMDELLISGGPEGSSKADKVKAELEGAYSLLKQQVKVLKKLAINMPAHAQGHTGNDADSSQRRYGVPPPPPPPSKSDFVLKKRDGSGAKSSGAAKVEELGGSKVDAGAKSCSAGGHQSAVRARAAGRGRGERFRDETADAQGREGQVEGTGHGDAVSALGGGGGGGGGGGRGSGGGDGGGGGGGGVSGGGGDEAADGSRDGSQTSATSGGGKGRTRRNTRGSKKKHLKKKEPVVEGGDWEEEAGKREEGERGGMHAGGTGSRDWEARREWGARRSRSESLSVSGCSDVELEQCAKVSKSCAHFLHL